MKIQPCGCCKDGKPGDQGSKTGYGFNRLKDEVREWAASNKLAQSEYCVRVKGGKRFGGPNWIKNKCGDGSMGFSTRRKGQDEVRIEQGLDGQFKRKRSTLVNKRSARAAVGRRARRIDGSKSGLVSSAVIARMMRDPMVVAQQRKVHRKTKRARNRNNQARRGHQRAMKLAA